jgi:hypothetical protein
MMNAGRQARLEVGAQRPLEAVACTRMFGPYRMVKKLETACTAVFTTQPEP